MRLSKQNRKLVKYITDFTISKSYKKTFRRVNEMIQKIGDDIDSNDILSLDVYQALMDKVKKIGDGVVVSEYKEKYTTLNLELYSKYDEYRYAKREFISDKINSEIEQLGDALDDRSKTKKLIMFLLLITFLLLFIFFNSSIYIMMFIIFGGFGLIFLVYGRLIVRSKKTYHKALYYGRHYSDERPPISENSTINA